MSYSHHTIVLKNYSRCFGAQLHSLPRWSALRWAQLPLQAVSAVLSCGQTRHPHAGSSLPLHSGRHGPSGVRPRQMPPLQKWPLQTGSSQWRRPEAAGETLHGQRDEGGREPCLKARLSNSAPTVEHAGAVGRGRTLILRPQWMD